jgi:hypothetical protein
MRRSVAATLVTILAIGSLCLIPNFASGDAQYEKLWIRMRGMITQWGSTPVFGWVGANARYVNANGTHHEWASVYVIWSPTPRRLNCTEPPIENFTFVFYTARLVNNTQIHLNYSGFDLIISGLWNVFKITTTINVSEDGTLIDIAHTFEPVVLDALGELRVFANGHQFEIGIEGIDLLSGFVVSWAVRYVEIKICDLNDDGKVDLVDLVRVARRYGKMPGLFDYDLDADFNFDGKIDIGDLTTVAASIEP